MSGKPVATAWRPRDLRCKGVPRTRAGGAYSLHRSCNQDSGPATGASRPCSPCNGQPTSPHGPMSSLASRHLGHARADTLCAMPGGAAGLGPRQQLSSGKLSRLPASRRFHSCQTTGGNRSLGFTPHPPGDPGASSVLSMRRG